MPDLLVLMKSTMNCDNLLRASRRFLLRLASSLISFTLFFISSVDAIASKKIPKLNVLIHEVKQMLCQSIKNCIINVAKYPRGFFQSNGRLRDRRIESFSSSVRVTVDLLTIVKKKLFITMLEKAIGTHHFPNRW